MEEMTTERLEAEETDASSAASIPINSAKKPPSRERLILAFAAVYLIWGSTYLGIKFAIATIPPFLMAGMRFLIAGSALYWWMRRRGAARPQTNQWLAAAVVGALLFLGGNGALTWAELRVDSGLASLIVSTIPLWMVLMTHLQHKLRSEAAQLNGRIVLGLTIGLAGIGLLVAPSDLVGHGGVDHLGAAILLCGSIAWTAGSLYSPNANLPRSTMLAASMEMICGGVLLLLLGLATGEFSQLHFRAISPRSFAGFLYLISFGSLLGFTSYNWLLSHSTPARVSTYAYVNPVVAVFLGWAVAGEAVTTRTLTAAGLVVAAVALIITHRERSPRTLTMPKVTSAAPVEEAPPLLPLE